MTLKNRSFEARLGGPFSLEAAVGWVTTVLELAGIGLIVAGAALVFLPAAFVLAGVGLLWISRGVSA